MSEDLAERVEEQAEVPAPVVAFVRALNAGEEEALLAMFADGALVNDEGQEHRDRTGVGAWTTQIVREQRLQLAPRSVRVNGDHVTLTAAADGAFDKRGLPNPLLLALYFSLRRDEIVQLIVLRREPEA